MLPPQTIPDTPMPGAGLAHSNQKFCIRPWQKDTLLCSCDLTLTRWPRFDLDIPKMYLHTKNERRLLRQGIRNLDLQQAHRYAFLLLWPWSWPDNLDIQLDLYILKVRAKMNTLGQGFRKLEHYKQTHRQTDRQTDATESLTTLHSRRFDRLTVKYRNCRFLQSRAWRAI